MTEGHIKLLYIETTGFDLDADEADLMGFARAIEQASRRSALEEAANTAVEKLKILTTEMEGYSYFGSNPGVKEDDYEDVANAIRSLATGDKHE
jgi:hypothetical protein